MPTIEILKDEKGRGPYVRTFQTVFEPVAPEKGELPVPLPRGYPRKSVEKVVANPVRDQGELTSVFKGLPADLNEEAKALIKGNEEDLVQATAKQQKDAQKAADAKAAAKAKARGALAKKIGITVEELVEAF